MASLPFPLPRRSAGIVVVLGLLALLDARADIDLPSVPPAQPEAVTARVFVGESVEIPLVGVSRSGAQLQFVIRRAPSAGRLSEITLTSRGTASVIYTHDAAAGPGLDRFRYAVRAPNGGFSTPADVTVNVSTRPPLFVAPARADFPDVALGRSQRQGIQIRNDGGGRLEGHLMLPPPWALVGSDGRYALGPGDVKSFTIEFTPTEDRRITAAGRFSHGDGVEMGLSGRGYAPVEVVPRTVRLEGDGRSEVRTGGFLLRNVSDEDRELRISAPPEVIVQDAVSVPAKSETQVAMHTRAGFLGALEGRVRVTGAAPPVEVPLRVTAAPPHLIAHPGAIDFGRLVAGRFGRVKLALRNVGGSPAALRVKLPEGVTLDPDPSYEALAPGDAREFAVAFARPSAGKLDDALAFESGGPPFSVPVRATVVEGPRGPDDATASATPSVPTNDVPPIAQIGFTQTGTSVELTWKRNSPDIVRYELIMRSIDFNARGEPVLKYTRLPRVKPRIVRDEVRATLEGLRPGENISLLVVGYTADGLPSVPSEPFIVFSKPRPPLRIPWTWIGLLAGLGFAVVLIRERRKARAASDAEFARSSQNR